MKQILLSLSLTLLIMNVMAQNETDIYSILKSTDDPEEIINRLDKYPDYKATVLYLDSETDSSDFDKYALSKKPGEIFRSPDNNEICMIVESDSSVYLRVRYIYFSGYEMGKDKIDKTRDKLISRFKSGESFQDLAKEFSMDGNSSQGGDLGWMSADMLDKTFTAAVVYHKQGDLFKIDIPENEWYYLVLKTSDEKTERSCTVVVVKSCR